MKILKVTQSDGFIPYAIQIDTQAEHDFVRGLFQGDEDVLKENCVGFDSGLDSDFYCMVKHRDKQLNQGL
jgi:hypothetical protein